jgi:HEAT repeat protein
MLSQTILLTKGDRTMTFRYALLAAALIASPAVAQVKPKVELPAKAPQKIKVPEKLDNFHFYQDLKHKFEWEHADVAAQLAHTADWFEQNKHDLQFQWAQSADLFKHNQEDVAFQIAQAAEAVKSVQHGFNYGFDRFHDVLPRQQVWYQGDPADSLYRAASGLLNRYEYRSAADRFSNLRTRHPNSRYFCDAAYYESLARYRLGTPGDLRTAYRVLDTMGPRCTTRSRGEDVPELLTRVNGALARLGDAEAAERLRRAASQGQNICDQEERNVKIEALSALAQMDPQAANPVLRTVLSSKDVCMAPVRRQALQLVARRNDAESVATLGVIARNDSDRETQLEAVRALGRMSNDAAFSALEEFLRTSNDERMQMEVASTMARSDNPRAQLGVRALLERNDVSERIRISAANALASRSNLSTDYWRSLYSKVESDELRTAVVNAIAKINTDEAHNLLLALARDPAQPPAARAAATSKILTSAPVNELHRLLQTADSRPVRQMIVSGIAARREPEATDRLIDIAKSSTDPEVRNAAIRALSRTPRKEDPKVVKAMADILGCCQ